VRRVALFLLLPLALAACGGSGSSKGSTTTVAAPTPADFVDAGNAVCIASDKRIFKIGRLGRDPKGWNQTAEAAKTAVREMRTVTPPAAKKAAFNQMLHYANALALTIQEIHTALVKKDYDTAAAGQFAAAQLQDKVHQSARTTGLTFCQQQLTNWPA
jgi:hypothetical protein